MTQLIQAQPQIQKNFSFITSITGVGPITATELILLTENFQRINSARKAAAYAGVCPYTSQSPLSNQSKSQIAPAHLCQDHLHS
ncbi:transposase [Phaeocystidibacter marisrubri]|uniref:IS110 family transposase n=1 Tax=Phaeocystidibacter marisrubri TaxID=1577780 RepID=A0A6L3ZEW8_9FLAO|nr:transposase [Phaeocystidibacter marisrubri]KAB2815967.1 IS110 family transposase [Phaeocystidibacter marisrubri]GGH66641.1 hypothetical protein GCM10011318_04820 [Phaeocystidibacter marisrubri]